jgi:hypothetical protein
MSAEPKGAVDVLRAIWAAEGQTGADGVDLDECGPTKICRNMKDVSFDGMAEPGTDLHAAWRDRLRREGKLNTGGGTVQDWVRDSPAERP